VDQGEGQRRVASRMGLEVQVGHLGGRRADRVDHDDDARRLGQPLLVGVWRGGRRVGSPDQDAPGIAGRARIEPGLRGAVQVAERDVAGHVADGVGFDLRGSEAMEEA